MIVPYLDVLSRIDREKEKMLWYKLQTYSKKIVMNPHGLIDATMESTISSDVSW